MYSLSISALRLLFVCKGIKKNTINGFPKIIISYPFRIVFDIYQLLDLMKLVLKSFGDDVSIHLLITDWH